ncbi:translation factor Sua5 [Deinococcus indicus]|uniref:L-threonylcarbamoyladenylate synthase n=1 Tax=Deinococcus indicus TaxID=223556 RepID=A0A246BHU6_9DEIO|nr:L-threonylcarbamoyladenylate synthase [Deinococcus indicus]OWL94448.1 translation factor Sua5 [Deinococcus indicus]GHG14406.1 SUA5-like protein [Deinococcus indicus]
MNDENNARAHAAPDWQAQVDRAAARLLAGGVVAYPSETVWGLAAHPDHPAAIRRLYELKGRDAQKPVQVSCLNREAAQRLILPQPALARLAPFWPGPLTVVTPARPDCPPDLAPGGRVGLRLPDHPVALALLERVGGLLATTSCNRSGEPAALTFEQARDLNLGDQVLPDGGFPALGVPSTVLLLPEGLILRAGAVSETQLRAALTDPA